MKTECPENRSCPQKDGAQHEEYAEAQSVGGQEVGEQDGADLIERILGNCWKWNTHPNETRTGGILEHP